MIGFAIHNSRNSYLGQCDSLMLDCSHDRPAAALYSSIVVLYVAIYIRSIMNIVKYSQQLYLYCCLFLFIL